MSIVNPEHPLHREMEGHWHKFVALLLNELPTKKITITPEMVDRLGVSMSVVVEALPTGELVLQLTTDDIGRTKLRNDQEKQR